MYNIMIIMNVLIWEDLQSIFFSENNGVQENV